ncbi:Asp/Glu/hydantoin racemase [Chromatiales bacterium (ex Bugula neritina AB1)]|nr:Asp/Glu/hydantoin racemase [Chromatiales bacterium (ex Bugula neritina AB1)]
MKIHLVNPNTTESMTVKAAEAARKVAAAGTEVVHSQPEYGPVSIEGYYDEVFAVPGMLDQIAAFDPTVDGHIIACFDDTGLDAARTIAHGPVVGICEAALCTAAMIANSYSVVTTTSRSVPALIHLVHKYGAERRCVNVRASDVLVLALEDSTSPARELIEAEIKAAMSEDGAEAIVLGCAGMADLASQLSDQFGLPVIDGVSAAVKQAEALISQSLLTSRVRGYARPAAKPYSGKFSTYAIED